MPTAIEPLESRTLSSASRPALLVDDGPTSATVGGGWHASNAYVTAENAYVKAEYARVSADARQVRTDLSHALNRVSAAVRHLGRAAQVETGHPAARDMVALMRSAVRDAKANRAGDRANLTAVEDRLRERLTLASTVDIYFPVAFAEQLAADNAAVPAALSVATQAFDADAQNVVSNVTLALSAADELGRGLFADVPITAQRVADAAAAIQPAVTAALDDLATHANNLTNYPPGYYGKLPWR